MVLRLSEWRLLEEQLSVSGCKNAAQHDMNGSLFVKKKKGPSFFDLCDNTCSDGGANISQHEAAQFFVVLV